MSSFCPESEYVPCLDRHLLTSEDLSPMQIEFLRSLNARLTELEDQIKKECLDYVAKGDKRVSDSDDWVEDYEIEYHVSFYLSEDDPVYDDDRDNVLVQFSESGKHERWDHGVGDGKDHRLQGWNLHPVAEPHCWLYYYLYDCTHLGWINILRIGTIWFDIEITYQQSIEL